MNIDIQKLLKPSEDAIVEAMEVSCMNRPSIDDDSYVLGILQVFLKHAGQPENCRSSSDAQAEFKFVDDEPR